MAQATIKLKGPVNTTRGTRSASGGRRTATAKGKNLAPGARAKATAKNEVGQIRGTAKGQARTVAKFAGNDVAGLVGSARSEAGRVGDEASGQVRELLVEARAKLQQQAEAEARRAAGNLGTFGSQAVALATGRPEEAGPLVDYAHQAADWLEAKASAIEEKGADGVAADVVDFASRRPAVFLLGAAAVGVGVGRLVRAGGIAAVSGDSSPQAAGHVRSTTAARSMPARRTGLR